MQAALVVPFKVLFSPIPAWVRLLGLLPVGIKNSRFMKLFLYNLLKHTKIEVNQIAFWGRWRQVSALGKRKGVHGKKESS